MEAASNAAMAARLGVKGDFVRVPQLAKALGISSNSIHAQMRRGLFPMPHRKVGNVVVVKLDDYARWFESEGAKPSKVESEPILHNYIHGDQIKIPTKNLIENFSS